MWKANEKQITSQNTSRLLLYSNAQLIILISITEWTQTQFYRTWANNANNCQFFCVRFDNRCCALTFCTPRDSNVSINLGLIIHSNSSNNFRYSSLSNQLKFKIHQWYFTTMQEEVFLMTSSDDLLFNEKCRKKRWKSFLKKLKTVKYFILWTVFVGSVNGVLP